MLKEFQGSGDIATAVWGTSGSSNESLGMEGRYHVECRDSEGNLKWVEDFSNQVTQAGKQLMLDTLLYTASGYTRVGPFLGLVNVYTGTVSAGSFVVGTTYQILVAGTTSFTAIGATNNTVGTVFTATGVGSGTGTATIIGTFSPTDTMGTHAGWTEYTNYTYGGSGVRGTYAFTASTGNSNTTPGSNVVSSTGTALTFTITGAGGNIGGCFLITGSGAVNTQSSTAGTLYSAGAFSIPKQVSVNDTVAVTYTTTATS
jgi:hypothetical protein